MNGVYIAAYDLTNTSNGVAKKINSQIKCFEDQGIHMQVLDINVLHNYSQQYKLRTFLSDALVYPFRFDQILQYACDTIDFTKIDFIYIRKGWLDRAQITLLRRIKAQKPNLKIIMEIPTYPYDKEAWGRRKLLAVPRDKHARTQLHTVVDRIVTYSPDDKIFDIPTIRISNGVDYASVQLKSHQAHTGIHLIAVALFAEWHGYDRLLQGLAENRALAEKENIVFHLVGDGLSLKSYQDIVERTGISKHVVFHGRLSGKALYDIYNVSDIGIDALGRHRSGVFYNSTLKGKEYCAIGLPSISGVETELDTIPNNFYLRVPADDSSIDISKIVEFYQNLCQNSDPQQLASEIRRQTQKYFDFGNAFKPVIDYVDV